MIRLKEVKNEEEEKIFAEYNIKCIKYHIKYARKLGINDRESIEYGYGDAVKYFGVDGYEQYLIYDDNILVGELEIAFKQSRVYKEEYLYIDSLYIDEEYRHKGYGTYVINLLKEKYKKRIELDCWYNIPAEEIYEKLGMKEMYTRLFL